MYHHSCFCFLATCALVLVGCDSGTMGVASVTGKVTANGKPVTGGRLAFEPIAKTTADGEAGKSGGAEIQPDGSYKMSTYGEFDGAVVGKHKVTFLPPTVFNEGGTPGVTPPKFSEFHNMVPKTKEVEVMAKDNVIEIELVNP